MDGATRTLPEPLLTAWRMSAPLRGAVLAGAIAGVVAAGVGSRVVMRIIALADSETDGAFTDAEATVGEFTAGGTFSLLFLGIAAGVLGGLLYLGLRRWLWVAPVWRGPVYGLVTLLTVGNLLFDTNNADFQIFEPVLLVIALFSVLFFVNGLLLAPLADRIHPEPSYPSGARVPKVAAGLIVLVCLVGLAGLVDTTREMIDDSGTCLAAAGGGNGCAVRTPGSAP